MNSSYGITGHLELNRRLFLGIAGPIAGLYLGRAGSNECVRPLFHPVPARHGGGLEPTHPDHVRGILDFLGGFL